MIQSESTRASEMMKQLSRGDVLRCGVHLVRSAVPTGVCRRHRAHHSRRQLHCQIGRSGAALLLRHRFVDHCRLGASSLAVVLRGLRLPARRSAVLLDAVAVDDSEGRIQTEFRSV